MPKLDNDELEAFAQNLAAGMGTSSSFMAAYAPNRRACPGFTARELMKRADLHARVLELRGELYGRPVDEKPGDFDPDDYVNREWILWAAVDNIEKCAGRKPVKKTTWRGGKPYTHEEYVFEPAHVNKGLEIIGREVGLFSETLKIKGDIKFSRMSNDELDTFIRTTLDSIKLIEGQAIEGSLIEGGTGEGGDRAGTQGAAEPVGAIPALSETESVP